MGLTTRKLAVTEARKLPRVLGTSPRKKPRVAFANCRHVAWHLLGVTFLWMRPHGRAIGMIVRQPSEIPCQDRFAHERLDPAPRPGKPFPHGPRNVIRGVMSARVGGKDMDGHRHKESAAINSKSFIAAAAAMVRASIIRGCPAVKIDRGVNGDAPGESHLRKV